MDRSEILDEDGPGFTEPHAAVELRCAGRIYPCERPWLEALCASGLSPLLERGEKPCCGCRPPIGWIDIEDEIRRVAVGSVEVRCYEAGDGAHYWAVLFPAHDEALEVWIGRAEVADLHH